MEHLNRLQRELLEILSQQIELREQLVRHVMMWQPIESACTTFRISRGQAQISSARGASTR